MVGRGQHATRAVLDASIWLKLFIAEPDSPEAAALIEGAVDLMSDAVDFAVKPGHPVYDCFYLALAQRLDVPLVTADRVFWRMVRRRRPTAKIRLLGM
jgi:predicted nucleic acid-binding protein